MYIYTVDLSVPWIQIEVTHPYSLHVFDITHVVNLTTPTK